MKFLPLCDLSMKASKRELLKVWIASCFLLVAIWSLASCQDTKKPSFIIIAADQLSFNSFSCNEDRETHSSGLNSLCQESIRFTNAFTTSPQTAAALGSLLTGQYPYIHALHRSFDRISPDLTLLSEYFKKARYRTSFWSGKPTVLKKTGLSRGFDVFDDSSFLGENLFSLRFEQQTQLLKNWIKESTEPFFSVIYTSELESLNEGETQLSTLESFDEKLGAFFNDLKKQNLWESNYIIVVGLQGHSEYNRPAESVFSNLHSENTNVALFVKPPRQKGDEGINWKYDSIVSLADVGYSLIKTVAPEDTTLPTDPLFAQRDLSAVWLQNKAVDTDVDHTILIESANTWTANLQLRLALLFKNFLLVESEDSVEFFNRLTDGLETIDIAKSNAVANTKLTQLFAQVRKNSEASRWSNFHPEPFKWVMSNRNYWADPNRRAQTLESEKKRLLKEKTTQPLSTLLLYFLNPKLEKTSTYEEARRCSYNLSLENIWGLWTPNKSWPQPSLSTENQ